MTKWKYLKSIKKKLLIDEFEIRPTSLSEYHKLSQFHYITTKQPTAPKNTFGVYHNDILYGIIIYNLTSLQLIARKKTILNKLLQNKTIIQRAKFLNNNVRSIARIVIHPSVRGIGLASKLIEESWRKLGVRFVEGFGFMAYYRNFHPDTYSYYIKAERVLKPSEFFLREDRKGAMRSRLKTPIMRYGYVLYINEKISCKL